MTRPDPARLAVVAMLAGLLRDARRAEAMRAMTECGRLRDRLSGIDAARATGADSVGLAAVPLHELWHGRARGRINTALARAQLVEAQAARVAAEAAARAAVLEGLAGRHRRQRKR